jgi:dipeptidyl aminopeptidase/acylaminoacyl peptidase
VKPLSSLAPFAFAAASALPAPAGSIPAPGEGPFTTRDLFHLRFVTGAAISPDGSTVAYVLAVQRDPLSGKDGPGFTELHVIGPDGRSRPFVTGEVSVGEIQFAPDGRSIAFLAKRGGDKNRSLYAIPVDGGEAQKLLEHETDFASFALHPTLRRVAFTAAVSEKTRKEKVDKGFSQEVFEEDWTNAQLFVAELGVQGSKPRLVPAKGNPSDLEWSPDGRNLLVALAPDPLVDSSYVRRKLHVIDAQSGEVVAQVDHKGKLGVSTMNPSGRLVALVSAADEHDPQSGRLTVASAFGGIMRELLPDFPGHFAGCAFASDETLLYLADRGCETVLGRIGVDGSGNQELLAQAGLAVGSFSLSRDGRRAALVAHAANHPPEVYAWEPGGKPRRLTDGNPWLAQRTLAAQEVFRFAARDGLAIEGILVRPLAAAATVAGGATAGPAPLVLMVHGGPESHVRNGWVTRYSEPAQVLAARGYAVCFPNYRASTGRGVAFSQLDHKDPAGKEFEDLVDAADALVAAGVADKAKVGVTGGSYGGYASGWCATKHSERFAAAVMGFGVSNLLSMLGTSDIPDEHYLVHHRLHAWDDWQLFLERSPIYHAKSSKTPILILAGKNDTRVPPSQSLELYRYLKVAGHPAVRLVLYPGEGHGNARAASRLDYHLRLLQWFDHYLKGPGGPPPDDELDHAALFGAPAPAPAPAPAAPAASPTGGGP